MYSGADFQLVSPFGDEGAASLSDARALAFVATQWKLQIFFPSGVSGTTRRQCARSHGTMEGVSAPVSATSACDSTIRCWHRRCGSIEALRLRLGRFDVAATLE